MFGLLAQIINIQSARLKELPTRLEKEKMKEFAQLDARYEVGLHFHCMFVLNHNF